MHVKLLILGKNKINYSGNSVSLPILRFGRCRQNAFVVGSPSVAPNVGIVADADADVRPALSKQHIRLKEGGEKQSERVRERA